MRKIVESLVCLMVLTCSVQSVMAGEFTDVIDAFDKQNDDPFDIKLDIGYERQYRSLVLRQETFNPAVTPHEWDYYAYTDVAKYEQVTHILNMQMEIGLFRDLSLKLRLPLILSDNRTITKEDGFYGSSELFPTSFKSAERSGVDYIAVGGWWGLLDQGRDDTKPNWTLFVEGRFGVGDTLTAACKSIDGTPCSDETYDNGDSFNTKGGISRGLNELAFGMHLSRRFAWMEPYFGLEAVLGWPKGGINFGVKGNEDGQINDLPPMIGKLQFGIEFIPWDVPEEERKLVIGLGGGGWYHSEGREATPLFDALGVSPYFNNQDYVDFNGNGQNDGGDETSAINAWTGMTDVENYMTFYGRLFVMIQPAKYVKFRLGMDILHETGHFITKTDQCPAGQIEDGKCLQYNWGHRPEIDEPGNRFRAEEAFLWNFFLDATAQF